MKDIFGNKKPVAIEVDEWWFNGRIIQKNDHPLLSKYISFEDTEYTSYMVETHNTFKEAIQFCIINPCKEPRYLPKDYLS